MYASASMSLPRHQDTSMDVILSRSFPCCLKVSIVTVTGNKEVFDNIYIGFLHYPQVCTINILILFLSM